MWLARAWPLLNGEKSVSFGETNGILGELATHAGPGGDGRE